MKQLFFLFLVTWISASSFAQYNFDFEKELTVNDSIDGWNRKNNQQVMAAVFTLDDKVKHSGNYSLRMTREYPDSTYKFSIANCKIPVDFNGEELILSCWLKTKAVTNRVQMNMQVVNQNGKLVGLLNYPQGFWKGDNEWTQFTTLFELPPDAHTIYLGFVMVGKGDAWADDFLVLVDGKPLSRIPHNGRTVKKAFGDSTEFKNGSNITVEEPNEKRVTDLALLGKIWGFLKYYHPAIANGNYNWDYALFRFLPDYLANESTASRNKLLLKWIEALGPLAPCVDCNESILQKAFIKPDLAWINDTTALGNELALHLNEIKAARHQGSQHYMTLAKGVGNPVIRNEDPYRQFDYPDAGYRLLCLFRYWNLIAYWFPDKPLIGEDWNSTLPEFIPRFLAAKNQTEYVLTTQQLIARIHDTHANVWGNKTLEEIRGRYFPPVSLRFIAEEPVVSGFLKEELAKASGLAIGDMILNVQGKSIKDIIRERLTNLPASNYPTQLRDLSALLLRSKDSILAITVLRNGKVLPLWLQNFMSPKPSERYQYDFPYQKDSSFFFIRPGIGYINLGGIKSRQVDSVFKLLQGSDGLIIDNRQYPGDFPLFGIAAKLLPDPIPFVKFPTANLDYPGLFTVGKPLSAGSKNKDYYKGKVVILVNEQTQSSGEYHTMAFRTAPNAVVIGSTTAGADGNVSGFYLPGNIYTMFSGIGILYPDGRQTQRVGIVPNIEVKRTVAGIVEGRDELLEKAIEIINGTRK